MSLQLQEAPDEDDTRDSCIIYYEYKKKSIYQPNIFAQIKSRRMSAEDLAEEPEYMGSVNYLKSIGRPVDTESYKCVYDIYVGLEGTDFEDVDSDSATSTGQSLGYLPYGGSDTESVLAKYKEESYGLSKEEIDIIDQAIERFSSNNIDEIISISELCVELDNNPHLKYILESCMSINILISYMINDSDKNEIDSDEVTDSITDIFTRMNELMKGFKSDKIETLDASGIIIPDLDSDDDFELVDPNDRVSIADLKIEQ